MRMLLVHAKKFSFRPTQKALKNAEELEAVSERSFDNVLAVFTTVEEADVENMKEVVE
ncbi:MAG: hypothetical protein DRO12_04480, partial [Thermoprotei archaeon]